MVTSLPFFTFNLCLEFYPYISLFGRCILTI